MRLILIAAHDPDLVIGRNGEMPWHYPEDFKHFKRETMGHPVLMGRGVFEEIGEKPLPGRRNVVLTRSRSYSGKKVEVFSEIEKALEVLAGESVVYVIGGGEIYHELIERADEMVITEIKKRYEGDVHFPEYRDRIGREWKEVDRKDADELAFVWYERILDSGK